MLLRTISVGFVTGLLVFAQEFRATISGRILDSTGGAIGGASTLATNASNVETSTATSDASGSYSIPFLRPGVYKLNVTAPGFKQFARENITLQVGHRGCSTASSRILTMRSTEKPVMEYSTSC